MKPCLYRLSWYLLGICSFFLWSPHAQAMDPGWQEISSTRMRDVCPPNREDYSFFNRCNFVISAWGGGAFDSLRNRLILFGGGHNDYYGNEVYVFDLNAMAFERLTDPSSGFVVGGVCVNALPDGRPVSRHTYGHLAYIEHADRFFLYGGSRACGSGGFGTDTWTFDFTSLTWVNRAPSGPNPGPAILASAYDPLTQNVFVRTEWQFYSYNYDANAWQKLGGLSFLPDFSLSSAVIDPTNRLYVVVGPAGVYIIELDSGDYTPRPISTSGPNVIIDDGRSPGLAYDPERKVIVAWDGSDRGTTPDTVYDLQIDPIAGTGQWVATSAPGGPSGGGTRGTFGRWRYVPSLKAFVVVNHVDENAFLYRANTNPDTTPPTGSVTEPAEGETVVGTIPIRVEATDTESGVAQVQIRIDGSATGCPVDTSFPYECTWDSTEVSNGAHSLDAVILDHAGNSFTTAARFVTVDNPLDGTDPTGMITAPADGATVNGTAVIIHVEASDNVGVASVQIRIDGNSAPCPLDLVAPYECAWNTTQEADGPHTLDAVILDTADNSTTASAITVTVNNNPDTTDPTGMITAPVDGATVNGSAVIIHVEASDNVGVASVQIRIDGNSAPCPLDSVAPYECVWNTTQEADGPHTLDAVILDTADNSTTASAITVTVNNNPDTTDPTGMITAPVDGATVNGSAVIIHVEASDNVGVASVQIRIDGNSAPCPLDSVAPYECVWNTTQEVDGPYTLDAVILDTADNSTTASAITVTVSNNLNFNVRDEFTTVAFSGNDGSQNWSNDWQESGESDNPSSGKIQIVSDSHCADSICLRLGGGGGGPSTTISREVNLSGATSATLTFSYRRSSNKKGGNIQLEVSNNGGGSWTNLNSYDMKSSDPGQVPQSYDLKTYIASNTQIRFGRSGNVSGFFFVDNVEISWK